MSNTIDNARIIPSDIRQGKPQAQIIGMINGNETSLLHFYDDEISFTEDEVNGLTEKELFVLWNEKDKDWLRS